MNAKEIRNLIIETLSSGKAAVAVKLDGHYFSGADIAIPGNGSTPEEYRIAVIPHKPQKQPT